MSNYERELAKITYADFEIEDHGIPVWNVQFKYEGSGQGIGGYTADTAFMMRLLCAVGVDRLSELTGKSCWVTHSWTEITKIEPLHKKEGEPFDIKKWQIWAEKRLAKISPYEMRTGINPKVTPEGKKS